MNRRQWLLAASCACVLPGCRLMQTWQPAHNGPPPPQVFAAPPNLEQVAAHLNTSSSLVQIVSTEGASVSIPGFPSLRAQLDAQPAKKIRFVADTSFTGKELDMGSNDEVFWFWLKQARPPALYFARHEQFAQSPLRQIVPIEPHWVLEMLGVIQIDPQQSILEGPFPRGPNQLELRVRDRVSNNPITRSFVINATYGWVEEEHIYDATGKLLASAVNEKHRFYPLSGVNQGINLPHVINVQLPMAQMQFRINVPQYAINQPSLQGTSLWEMPTIQGVSPVDLAQLNPASVPQPAHVKRLPPTSPEYREARPRYRGYSRF